jgi:hypothetical protein
LGSKGGGREWRVEKIEEEEEDWKRNTGGKSTEGIKKRKKGGRALKIRKKNSPFNFNRL